MKPVYTIEVGAKVEQARTSSALGIGVGRMQLEDRAKGGRLRAMASAQVYFARPQHLPQFRRIIWGRTDHSFEQGSMFSPYWQVRLVETPGSDRTMLAAMQ